MDKTYQKFLQLGISLASAGMAAGSEETTYYCTPKGASVIGWAGVDGIHYCTIPEFGEMIFAVSPMNFGDCVHPIARNFEDLLRLLLCCVDMAALEQCHAWDEEQFKAFLAACPATEEQRNVLETIQREFGLEPMEDAFAYVKKLQAEFDLSGIPYTEDYFDPDMNAAAPVRPAAWKVIYNGGFGDTEGSAGEAVTVGKTFFWGSEKWYIPAVYLCDEGLVVDFLTEADPVQVKALIDKWDLFGENRRFTEEQQEQISRENPLDIRFCGHVTYNGQALQADGGCSLTWLPECCLPQGGQCEAEAKRILDHYGLDTGRAWSIHRCSYRWGNRRGQKVHALSVRMERERENFTGRRFVAPAVGKSIALRHPLSGQTCTLTVHELERQELPADAFRYPEMEYPAHFLMMSYSLQPDIHGQGFMLRDCSDGDSPRQKTPDPNAFAPAALSSAAVIGIIGGADGPTAVIAGRNTPARLHAACSSLHFEPVNEVEWRAVFSEKTMDDMTVRLI